MARGHQKSVVLTYHRVTDDEAVTDFYDVPVSRFTEQVARIAASKTDMPVVVTFDDGTADHRRAGDILADRGLKGVFFIVTDWIDQPGYLTRDDVRHMAARGQIIGSHTLSHRQLPTLSDEELRLELTESRRVLEDLTGQRVEWFAPPGGMYDARTLSAVRNAGYLYARTMDWGYAPRLQATGVDQLIPTAAILRNMTDRRLDEILNGKASFAAFALKQFARQLLPGRAYARLRGWTLQLAR